jgi:type III pantothenate kinase
MVKIGIFRHDRLIRKYTYTRLTYKTLVLLGKRYLPVSAIVSSVVEVPAFLLRYLNSIPHSVLLQPDTPVPIKNHYRSKSTLGSDRLAGVVGAFSLFKGRNVLVIDAGTCIKYDFLDKGGNYHGGSISPGISMRLRALHEQTGKLPLITSADIATFQGNDTRTSILTGVIKGASFEIEGFVKRYKKEYSRLVVILTGGDAVSLSKHLNFSIFAAPDLLMIGLNSILLHDSLPHS